MTWAPATSDCPSCGASSPANARFCGECGRLIQRSTLSPQISHLHSLEEAFEAFQQQYPTHASTASLDDLRAKEYARLDQQRHVYLDYTSGGLHAESQLRAHGPADQPGVWQPLFNEPGLPGHDRPGGTHAQLRAGVFQR